jgi:type 1 glutamine amidotransferase
MSLHRLTILTLLCLVPSLGAVAAAEPKQVVLVAGKPSHPPGAHEFNAGVRLLARCLESVPEVQTTVHLNGWPTAADAFESADAIVLYMDGYGGHELIQHDRLEQIGPLMQRGVGLACLHYAVEVPKDDGGPELLEWIGGYYERGFSTNPHWTAQLKLDKEHPITRGVQPDAIEDEWYFNMRFRPDLSGVVSILRATPDDAVRQDRRNTETTRAQLGREETLAWAYQRPDGGRGFGFTGGHFHANWGNDNVRRLVLNAIVWTAGAEVPAGGVQSTVTEQQLQQNLDPKPARTR